MSDPSHSEYRTIYSRVCSGCYHRNRARRNAGDHRDLVSADTASAATRRPVFIISEGFRCSHRFALQFGPQPYIPVRIRFLPQIPQQSVLLPSG